MSRPRPLKLSVPPRTTSQLQFCDGTPAGLQAWLDGLPVREPVPAAQALLGAVTQANACEMAFATRFDTLEALRPQLHIACSGISRRGRDASPERAERQRKEAALAQRLQYQLATGYKMVIVDALRGGVKPSPDRHATDDDAGRVLVAIHRTLTELGHTLLRSLQFYTPPPRRLWEQLHNLYYLAELRRVQEQAVEDTEHLLRPRTTIGDAYARVLLLGAARPNTLRYGALSRLFVALEDWTREVQLRAVVEVEEPVILLDLTADAPPLRASVYTAHDDQDARALDTWKLVDRLDRHLKGTASAAELGLKCLDDDHETLIRHAVDVWGALAERAYPRRPASGSVQACVGLDAVHFHAGGQRTLRQQLQSRLSADADDDEEDDYFDPFAGSADVGGVNLSETRGPRPKRVVQPEPTLEELLVRFPIADLTLADASTGGYGLISADGAPAGLLTSELIGILEDDDPDWSIAQVRWLANQSGSARIGAELLAARPETGAGRIVSSRGEATPWHAVVLLPGVAAIGQPATLLTALDAFEAGQKIAFRKQGRDTKLLIESELQRTESFQQFQVRELGATAATTQNTGIEVDEMSEEEELAALEAFGLDPTQR